MIKRIRLLLAAVLTALSTVVALAAPSAAADTPVPPSSAGQRWALKVAEHYVTVSAGTGGDSKLRANLTATAPGPAEQFTLHTDWVTGGFGTTVSFRSEATGNYVTTEDDASASMLRTRATTIGSWERFTLKPLSGDTFGLLASNGKYVAAELGTYPDAGLLRARTAPPSDPNSLRSWERFSLVKVGGQGSTSPAPAPTAQAPVARDVVSWNVCGNNNGTCSLDHASSTTVANNVSAALHQAMGTRRPDAIFFQEICEKAAKPLELALESWAGPMDVRFMPTSFKVAGTAIEAQKDCDDTKDGVSRGSFGVALAVPDSNTWYQGTVLPSPPKKPGELPKEQRPMLCAVMPAEGTAYCNAHFSSGPYTDANGNPQGDDTDSQDLYRPKQAQAMRDTVDGLTPLGYTTYYGGDLNTTQNDVGYLDPLYPGHQECGQPTPSSPHTGAPTDGNNKIDYIFGPQGPTYTCRVVDGTLSDHRMINLTTS
ncbi:endonuclease/exonuclease/phosphatase family protein [Streptomyces sp. NPDC090023]|uniref:endonuclease/exonuclease/phosphatase family protein n=1 Tax=unclassified Streptomyces TaxID=2593676 RepID=UPI0037FD9987